jgi:hypothetical protein
MGKKKFNLKNECFKVIRGMKLYWKSTEETEGIDHEVEFHEIKIQLFQEIKLLIMRSKFLIIDSIS